MNAITQLDVLDLEHTIARYDVGDLVRYWPAVNGIENSNYFIRTRDRGREREFVLTIMEQPSNAGGAYVPLLAQYIILRNIQRQLSNEEKRKNSHQKSTAWRCTRGHGAKGKGND